MQKSTRVLLYILSGAVIVSAVGLSSCSKDDDEPEAKPMLTFSEETVTVNEDEGTLEIEVKLDKAATDDITIEYELDGTAQDYETSSQSNPADYRIPENYGELEIEKGETTGTITLRLFSDDQLEDDETIVVTITDVDDIVELGTGSETTITLQQEDGVLVFLSWPESGTDGVADMDLFIRIGETSETPTWNGIVTGSIFRGYQYNYEFTFLPKAFIGTLFNFEYTDTVFGLTYTYYDGTLDPLEFEVDFIEFTDGVLEEEEDAEVFTATYEADNINKWAGTVYPTIITQTIRLNNGEFQDLSDLSVPATSSRVNVANMNTELRNLSARPRDLNLKTLRKGVLQRLNLQ